MIEKTDLSSQQVDGEVSHKPGDLPFFKILMVGDEQLLNYWLPKITGSSLEDHAIGRFYGELMIDYLQQKSELGSGVVLVDVVRGMKFDGLQDAVNDGFLERIGEEISGGS